MKRKILVTSIILLISLLLPAAAFAKPGKGGKTRKAEPIVVDEAEEVYAGGDKIHIIKPFEGFAGSDAILLESDGHYAMVDVGVPYDYDYGGTRDTENSVINYLESYGVEKLDFIILTHMHIDHVGNLENILRTFPVDKVYARYLEYPSGLLYFYNNKPVNKVCAAYDVPEEELFDEEYLELGNFTLKILNLDDEPIFEKRMENSNSLGVLVTDGFGHKAFLAGDIDNYDGDEDRLTENHYEELKSVDYLKAGHHGYIGSSTAPFISMLNPRYVGITGCGITNEPDPFGEGNTVFDNYAGTRAAYNNAFFNMHDSQNGVIFTMGESMSINSTFCFPSRTGKANNTLSVYYNANGGTIKDSRKKKFYINETGNICSNSKDRERNHVHERAKNGVIAPMYFYDLNRALESPETFGLERLGHTFNGWYNDVDRAQLFETGNDYEVNELAPELTEKSTKLVLSARWKANNYTVLYHANGGSGTMNALECTYNKREFLEQNRYVRNQYVFIGWNTKKDGSGEPFCDGALIKNLTAAEDETIVLYAQWEKLGVGSPQEKLVRADEE